MPNNILGLPKKALSEFQKIVNSIKAKRGKPDGFVGTDIDGYAETTQLGSGTPGTGTKFLLDDGVWSAVSGAGIGDVTGDDTTTTVQNIVAYNSVGGKNITELTGTQGDVLYHNGTSWAKLPAGTSGQLLKTNGAGANPAWTTGSTGDVTAGDLSTTTQNIVAYQDGTGQVITELNGTQGDILYHNGSFWNKLNAGTDEQVLKTNGAGQNPAWDWRVTGDDTSTTAQNIVAYSDGNGRNVTELTGTQGDILYHNGTSWQKLAAGTDGKVLGTQGAGANPRWQPVVANGVYVDNVTDLEAAVNGASAGAVIYVAAGNYQLTGTLVLDVSRIKIIGAGRDATYLRGLNENTDIISIQADSVMVADLSLQHSSFAGGTGNGKGSAGSGRGIVFEMEVTSSDNYGSCIIERLNILNTASWGIYDTGVYSMEDISYGDGFASAGLFSNTAEHPFPIWGYKTAIDSTTVAGIPVKADVSAVSTWSASGRTITSAGAFTNVRVGNYVYDVAGDIPHGAYVTAKASDSSITISKDTIGAGTGVTLYFSRRTNCRVTVKNIINDVNFAFQNSGGAMYVGYGATTTYIKDIKTNNYSFGSFCAHNDTTPSAACTRGAVDIYGTIVTDLYSPIFQSPSKQSGVVVTAHDDTDATMLSIRYAGSVHVYSAYFETLSSNLEDGVDWRARGADAYGYRQYWFITGYNSSDVVFHAPFFVCSTSRKLDPAWLVGDVYYAGFPARLVRTLADAGGFAFTMLGGRVSQWREFYHASLFGHATPPAPFEYGDFYPCEENGVDTANPWDDDDFLLEGTGDGSVTQPINIEDLEISNHMNGFRREPTAPKGTAIYNRPCFRMHNNGRTLKLGMFNDIAALTGGTSSMDNASDRLSLSQDFKGGHIAYVLGAGDGDGSVQREGLWAIANRGHDWRQIPYMRIHPSIWPDVYAGDLWMKLGSASAGVYTVAEFRWYDGSAWRVAVGLATGTTATGDLIYYSAADTPARLAVGSNGDTLVVSGGVPAWTSVAGQQTDFVGNFLTMGG